MIILTKLKNFLKKTFKLKFENGSTMEVEENTDTALSQFKRHQIMIARGIVAVKGKCADLECVDDNCEFCGTNCPLYFGDYDCEGNEGEHTMKQAMRFLKDNSEEVEQ